MAAATAETIMTTNMIRVSLRDFEVAAPSHIVFSDERALKRWILEEHSETVLSSLSAEYCSAIVRTQETNEGSSQQNSENETWVSCGETNHRRSTSDDDMDRKRTWLGIRAHVDSPSSSLSGGSNIASSTRKRRSDLLDCIAAVQRQFFQSEAPTVVFGLLLDALLKMTDSEYGFIGEIKFEDDGTMFLQTHAITNIAWNQATHKFYDDNRETGLKFFNLKSLFGTVMTTGKPLVANDPAMHPKRAGLPEGHPPLNHFLGIPFFKTGGEINGMVGISNKPGGYSVEDINFLEPLTVTCSNLIQAYVRKNENEWHINNLENSVRARTNELELANASLEEANRKVKQTAQMQLKHFACMSHEIRTPLNCIIGMSSLLKETKMTGMQQDTMEMIIASGDLLVAIVNDVLDYSKLETGSFELEIRKSNLEQTLCSILQSIEAKAQPRGQSVLQRYSVSLPKFVHIDSRRVQQILFNLLGNAIKFSKDNSVIEFSVEYLPSALEAAKTEPLDHSKTLLNQSEAPVTFSSGNSLRDNPTTTGFHREETHSSTASSSISEPVQATTDFDSGRFPFRRSQSGTPKSLTSTDSNSAAIPQQRSCDPATCSDPGYCRFPHILRFVVKDYGRGVPKTDFEKIFKPFQQVINSEAEDVHGGTGLGLAITRRLVSAMKGAISVDSELGAWSEFTVDIPCCDPPTDVSAFKGAMQDATAIVVGAEGLERERVQQVFECFETDFIMFESMQELQSEFLDQSLARPDRIYICLFQEDAYHRNREPYNRLSSFTRSSLIMFGNGFRVSSGVHFRSLLTIMPSVFMERMLETLRALEETRCAVEETQALEESKGEVPYKNIRVLVAEDNKVNQKVLQRILERLGVKHIDIVENGKLAVEKEAENKYDVILMDQQMPIMGGIAACRHIVSRSGSHPIPFIVFVTAHVSPDFEAKAYEAGCTDFLAKPFKLDQIEAAFEKLFAGS